jgi:hypothetical protein
LEIIGIIALLALIAVLIWMFATTAENNDPMEWKDPVFPDVSSGVSDAEKWRQEAEGLRETLEWKEIEEKWNRLEWREMKGN